jgi:hypothetical protein
MYVLGAREDISGFKEKEYHDVIYVVKRLH